MLLKDILNDLIRNELGNVVDGKPEWSDGNFSYTKLIQCISLGLIELHKRFTIKREIVQIIPLEGINAYLIDPIYALNNPALEPKYIIDTPELPFTGNIVKVESLYNDKYGSIEFDTTQFGDEIYLLNEKTIFIRNPVPEIPIYLKCRGLPKSISLVDEGELDTYEVNISEVYLEALLMYAAGRAYTKRGAENATNNESAIYFSRFEAACSVIIGTGLELKENHTNHKLHARGFV